MRIFSDQEKEKIKQDILRLGGEKDDPKHNFNVIELGMALMIIQKVLGEEWYARAGKEINEKIDVQSFLKNKQSPISSYLLEGDPAKYIRLINFATFLKSLLGITHIQTKLKEYAKYTKKKNKYISVEKFDSTYFELKIASYFVRNGFRAEFIKELKDEQTPDLRIVSGHGTTIVECKKKRGKENYSTLNIMDSIREANNQLEASVSSGLIAVEVSSKTFISDMNMIELQKQISLSVIEMPKVFGVLLLNEYVFSEYINEMQVLRTEKYYFANEKSEQTLPQDIRDVILNPNPPPQISLYED